MVDKRAKAVGNYLLEIIAGLAIVLGALMLIGGVVRVDIFGIVLGAVLVAGGVFVFKRPSRNRRAV